MNDGRYMLLRGGLWKSVIWARYPLVCTALLVFISSCTHTELIVADRGDVGGTPSIFQIDPLTGTQALLTSGGLLIQPYGVAIAANGDVLVADTGTSITGAIVRVDASGSQSFLSSNGDFVNPVGVAVGADGRVYVADSDCCNGGGIFEISNDGAQRLVVSADSTEPAFSHFIGIAVEQSGQLLVEGDELFRVDPESGSFSQLTPNNTTAFGYLIAVEPSGDVLIADASGQESPGAGGLYRFDQTSLTREPLSRGGAFVRTMAPAVDKSGGIYVSDDGAGGPGCDFPGCGAIFRIDGVSGAQTPISVGGDLISPTGIVAVERTGG